LTAIPGDSATNFDGSNDYITAASYEPLVSNLSVALMLSRDTSASVDCFIAQGDGYRGFLASGSQNATVWDGTFPAALSGNGAAHHLVAATPGGSVELYRDGESLGVEDLGIAVGGGSFRVGAHGAGANPLDGKVSHVAVFERVLTAQEVGSLADWATTGLRSYSW
jgi:hypothetical protein